MALYEFDKSSGDLKEVINSKHIVLLDFWATWCGPCKLMDPIIKQFSESRDDIDVIKVNVDTDYDILSLFDMKSVPTLFLYKDGVLIARNNGSMNLVALTSFVNNNIA